MEINNEEALMFDVNDLMGETDEGDDTMSEIEKLAKEATMSLLPTKSLDRYKKTYKEFQKWRKIKNDTSPKVEESTVLAWLADLSTSLKPTSLWSYYSQLKATLKIYDDLDISTFKSLVPFLKNKSKGYTPKRAEVFTEEDVKKFVNEAPDDRYLAHKVAIIFGLSGACRMHELIRVRISHVKVHGDMFLVELPVTKNYEPRSFVISGEFVNIVKKYMALRPENAGTDRFFLRYENGRCTRNVIGEHKLKKMPYDIAVFLGLPNPHLYTGHAFRRTSATIAVNAGAKKQELKKLGGWRSDSSANIYVAHSTFLKKKTNAKIMSTISNTNPATSTGASSTILNPSSTISEGISSTIGSHSLTSVVNGNNSTETIDMAPFFVDEFDFSNPANISNDSSTISTSGIFLTPTNPRSSTSTIDSNNSTNNVLDDITPIIVNPLDFNTTTNNLSISQSQISFSKSADHVISSKVLSSNEVGCSTSVHNDNIVNELLKPINFNNCSNCNFTFNFSGPNVPINK